jgi:hypothetical protein
MEQQPITKRNVQQQEETTYDSAQNKHVFFKRSLEPINVSNGALVRDYISQTTTTGMRGVNYVILVFFFFIL